ncbi:syntaxin-8 [Parasteatoda tepidariorum]|uniref:syntaxin-8 n=1 Tax=Parasteatoda tepidariorum TaxID=114398 RepID=UPI001C729808|nr:syntaxin-8-like isoform X2 [Parasteatoda tepidariorum]
MAFRQDSWMASYNSCESLAREIMEKISYRNQQPKNSVASGKASAQARKLMKKFSDNLSSLKQTLLASKDLLTEGEFERRERLIDGLNNKNTQINDAFSGREEGGNRQALLGAEMVTPSTNVWGMEEDERTRDLSFNEIKEQQLMAIQEQDKGLDTLHDVVVRQKHMAANIGQELDLQNEIIDDIVDHADNTRERLIKETRHVAIVDRKSGECCYWVIIVLLFIAIVVIAVIPS